jgi:hypothetical protein
MVGGILFIYQHIKIAPYLPLIRYMEGLPLLAMFSFIPFMVDDIFKLKIKEKYDLPLAGFIYVVVVAILFFIGGLITSSLYYSTFFMNLDLIYYNRESVILIFLVASIIYPFLVPKIRNRLLRKIADSRIKYSELFYILLGVGVFYFFISPFPKIIGQQYPGNYLYGSQEWLVGVPALFLFFYLRLKRRGRYSLATYPFVLFLTSGLGSDLLFNFSLPLYIKFFHLFFTFMFGSFLFIIYYVIYKKIVRATLTGGEDD